MATTSLKLPDTLKERIVKLASDANKTAHAFMIEAIAEKATREEQQRAFMARAEASLQHYKETGIAYDADEVMAYCRGKIQGIELPKPQPIKRL